MSETASEKVLPALRPATISDLAPAPAAEPSTEGSESTDTNQEAAAQTETPEQKAAAEQAAAQEKQRKSAAARIGAAVRQQREAERERDALAARVRELERAKDPASAAAALDDARIEQRAAERAAQMLAQKTAAEKTGAFFDAGQKEDPDFREKAVAVGEMLGSDPKGVSHVLIDIPNGHRAVEALHADPDLAEKIFAMPIHKMTLELAKLAEKPEPKPKPVSNAPDPIRKTAGVARSDGYRSDFTVAEHLAWVKKTEGKTP